jgi:hypothetical protein
MVSKMWKTIHAFDGNVTFETEPNKGFRATIYQNNRPCLQKSTIADL